MGVLVWAVCVVLVLILIRLFTNQRAPRRRAPEAPMFTTMPVRPPMPELQRDQQLQPPMVEPHTPYLPTIPEDREEFCGGDDGFCGGEGYRNYTIRDDLPPGRMVPRFVPDHRALTA